MIMRVCRGVPGQPCNKIISAADYLCPECKHKDNQRRAAKSKRNGLRSPYWQAVREARLRLDGYRCVLQHDGCTGYAETVHIPPELKGNHLLATVETCRSACRRCHGVEDGGRAHARRWS
jgi:5-methylcytosine-specific restriction endonuclease McrA